MNQVKNCRATPNIETIETKLCSRQPQNNWDHSNISNRQNRYSFKKTVIQ